MSGKDLLDEFRVSYLNKNSEGYFREGEEVSFEEIFGKFRTLITGEVGTGTNFIFQRKLAFDILNNKPNHQIFIFDADGEVDNYFANDFGIEVRNPFGLAKTSKWYNPFLLCLQNKSIKYEYMLDEKLYFVKTFFEIAINRDLNKDEETILRETLIEMYEPYFKFLEESNKEFDIDVAPTIKDFYKVLKEKSSFLALVVEPLEFLFYGNIDLSTNKHYLLRNNYVREEFLPLLVIVELETIYAMLQTTYIENNERKNISLYFCNSYYLMDDKRLFNFFETITKVLYKKYLVDYTLRATDFELIEDAIANNIDVCYCMGQTIRSMGKILDTFNLKYTDYTKEFDMVAHPTVGEGIKISNKNVRVFKTKRSQ